MQRSGTVTVRKAEDKDVEDIYLMLRPYWLKGLILERTQEDIRQALIHFHVALINGSVVGVISYHDYGKHLKEIRSLAVKEEFAKRGIGTRLVKSLVRHLRKTEKPKIFALSYTPVFFEKNGFKIVNKETLPEKIWKDCVNCKDVEHCGETALILPQ